MSLGCYPNDFKLARVVPIFKKGNRIQCENYRPISILPCLSKILERIIHNQVYNFLDKNKLLCPAQYGFRRQHSTELAVLDLYDRITKSLAKKQYITGIFLDLSKAFDTLDHSILIYKLERHGIRGTPLAWFKDYLSNRVQYTEVDLHQSQTLDLQCGVPQGSILGPLLFILYMNDIVKSSRILSYVLFADDTTLLYSHHNFNEMIATFNMELSKLTNWLRCNKLSLNLSKTKYIVFHNPNKKINEDHCQILIHKN